MLIDWFTVGAQALNFIVLVWLLKRLLYKPILDAIDARERGIAAELAGAAAKMADAQKEREEFRQRNEAFDRQRAALLNKALDEARAERERILEAARRAADALGAKRQERLRSDAHNLNSAIRRRTEQEVFAVARKALKDLAATDLEERMAHVLIERLRTIDGDTKAELTDLIRTASGPVVVRSAFGLSAEQGAAIKKALEAVVSSEVATVFETAPDFVSGIEITVGGKKISWSIADYLVSLEERVVELLDGPEKVRAADRATDESRASAPTIP